MVGRIVKIDPLKSSRNKGNAYVRVYFQLRDYESTPEGSKLTYKWAKTDLVTKFRNYSRWSPYLHVGAVFSGLKLKDKNTVDADSKIAFDRHVPVTDEDNEKMQEKITQLSLL